MVCVRVKVSQSSESEASI